MRLKKYLGRCAYFQASASSRAFSAERISRLVRLGNTLATSQAASRRKSTKAGVHGSAECIGEKGIGFKSVFKVASVVYISSGNFSFKFDSSEPIGMIAPIWSHFPEPTSRGLTSFYLVLSGGQQEENIDLKSDGSLVPIHDGTSALEYVIVKHRASNLPEAKARPGRTETEVILAFPVILTSTQPVFAFLPIRDYGLHFALHGDFLLTASREEIEDVPWNSAVRDASADAFVGAIDHLTSSPLQYSWPQYLPQRECSGFFQPLRDMIFCQLAEKLVLESQGGTRVKASQLKYVPEEFSDDLGEPFTLSTNTENIYVSSQYSGWTAGSLSSLRIQTLDGSGFLEDLGWLVANQPERFQRRPTGWQSQISKVLVRLATETEHKRQLQSMNIIPLQNGDWLSANSGPIYFGTDMTDMKDHNVDFPIVDIAAEQDSCWRSLLVQLGVRSSPQTADVCQHIIERHSSNTFDPEQVKKEELCADAAFLFQASFHPTPGARLWVATTGDGRAEASSCHTHGMAAPRGVTGKIMCHLEESYPFLHEDYMKPYLKPFDPLKARSWLGWLQRCFRISTEPRLYSVEPGILGRLTLSEEFRFLFRTYDSSDAKYSALLENHPTLSSEIANKAIRTQIQLMKVSCHQGQSKFTRSIELQNTSLPMIDKFVDHWLYIPTLTLRDPEDSRWTFLKFFGVEVNQSMQLQNPHKETVAYIYRRIQVDEAFTTQKLIYTIAGSPKSSPNIRWLGLKECVEQDYNIAFEYRDSKSLFQDLLGTGLDSIERLVEKATKITNKMSRGGILQNFTRLNRALATLSTQDAEKYVKPLHDHNQKGIFPILQGPGDHDDDREYDTLDILNPAFPPWFIADRHHLRESFVGHLKILAFEPEEVDAIEALLNVLGLNHRRLSALIRVETFPSGRPKTHRDRTIALREKAPFISALIPKSRQDRDKEVTQLHRLDVNLCASIVCRYKLSYGGRVFHGTDGQTEVTVSVKDDRLQIFMTRYSISSSLLPPKLVNSIADLYGIVKSHRALVQFALSENNHDRLGDIFQSEGIYVTDSLYQGQYAALWRDEFEDVKNDDFEESDEDKIMSEFNQIPRNIISSNTENPDDRRLPLQFFKWSERILFRQTTSDPTLDHRTILRQEPVHAQYLAEVLTSMLLQHHVGKVYNPDQHWTNPLRYRAGHSIFPHAGAEHASFTISGSDASFQTRSFLARSGCFGLGSSKVGERNQTYHFDIVVTTGDSTPEFSWTTQQFERMRKFRLDKQLGSSAHERDQVKDVHVLVRIANVFKTPRFSLFVDPWRLFISDKFDLKGDWVLTAAIIDDSLAPMRPPLVVCGTRSPSTQRPTTSTRAASPYRPPFEAGNNRLIPQLAAQHGYSYDMNRQVPPPGATLSPESAAVFQQKSPIITQWPNTRNMTVQHHPSTGPYPTSYRQSQTPSPLQLTPPIKEFGQLHPHKSSQIIPQLDSGMTEPYWNGPNEPNGEFKGKPSQASPDYITRSATHVSTRPLYASDYSYKELRKGDIRMLLLHPEKKPSNLQATVFHSPLLIDLSHVLRTPEGCIKITASLYDVLCSLRHEKKPLLLWVDAVCINQENKSEKAGQIPTCVLACIGDLPSGNNPLQTLMQIRVGEALSNLGEEWPKDLPEIPQHWGRKRMPNAEDATWDEIRAFFEISWFRRAWIIQEVVVATSIKIVYGKWMVDWNDLHIALETIERELGTSPTGRFALARPTWSRFLALAMLREEEARHHRRSLIELLKSFRYAESTIRHDRFFCLLALAIDGNNKDFPLDYDLTFEDLVGRYTSAFISQRKVLDLLHNAGLASPSLGASWIPDWTVSKQESLLSLSIRGMQCSASKQSTPNIEFDTAVNKSRLGVQGILVDNIKTVSKASNTLQDLDAYLKEVENMIPPQHPDGKASLKWKVPIAEAFRRADGPSIQKSYNSLRKYLSIRTRQRPSGAKEFNSQWEEGQNYYSALQGPLAGWKFVVTYGKRVGVAPLQVNKGDAVCVVNGGQVPFVLRSSGHYQDSFQLVGECYIHGLMNEEASTLGLFEQMIQLR
ncbi:hypothetical protein B0T10DRAFT_535063 [Thelonectria olida]|uniref:Heterokaryon incompatibility domain-containing protein n=1 Tax=Thelonectria olida TaxID=1576542 RepID=A0A9P9AVX4_9HYPO|nr:hypothetical protein B0T10DRAFT_535063 [Thelonectria olida]